MAIPHGKNQVVHRDGLINDQGAKKKLESQGWKILGEPKVATHVTVEVLTVKAQVLEGPGLQFTQWILNLYGLVHFHWFSLSGLEMGESSLKWRFTVNGSSTAAMILQKTINFPKVPGGNPHPHGR